MEKYLETKINSENQSFSLETATRRPLLSTKERLSTRGWKGINQCNYCYESQEDEYHVFFKCPYAAAVWNLVNLYLNVKLDPPKITSFLKLKSNKLSFQDWRFSTIVVTSL